MSLPFMKPEDERYRLVLARIQQLWHNYNMCSHIEIILRDCFTIAENPYAAALYFLANNETYRHSRKTSFSTFLMKVFENWLQEKEDISHIFLNKDIKLEAFTAVNEQKQGQLIKKVVEIYQIKADKQLFLPYISELIYSQRFKQACQASTVLELHDCFNINDFLVPLLLQDKLGVVEEFLEDSTVHQKNMVAFLDGLLGEKNILEEMKRISEELKVEDAKLHRFNQKYISKLIGRYLKEFKLLPEACTNYMALQKRKALHFVIWKKYIDKTLEGESWSEMMLEIVKDCPKLQYEMVESLAGHHDDDEAYRWCNYFQLDKQKLPARLKYMIETAHLQNEGEEENWDDEGEIDSWKNSPAVDLSNLSLEPVKMPKWKKSKSHFSSESQFSTGDWEMETSTGCASVTISEDYEEDDYEDQISSSFHKKQGECEEVEKSRAKGKHGEQIMENIRKEELEFHHLQLSDDKIILVDSVDSLMELIHCGLQGVQMIGLDCEWKPSFYSQKSKVALLQMALWDRIYLVDVLSLSKIPSDAWDDFNKIIFENEAIIKLGFDIHADKSMLIETVPYLKGFGTASFLDLSSVWKTLVSKHRFMFPNGDKTLQGGNSLTQLVTLCFGKSLDKSDQFSNWENRPLRKSQQLYAALDAYCLLEIYQFFKNECLNQGIPFNEIVNATMRGSKSCSAKPSKKQKKRNNKNLNTKCEESQEQPKSDYPPSFPQTHKMVCDAMIQGLGRKLRSCGINTWILQNCDDADVCLKIALRDNRTILTRGSNYHRFIKYVGHEQCYQVRAEALDDQVKEVLDHFNVVLREEDVFSRCQICNGDMFVEVPNCLMKKIVGRFSDIPIQSFGGLVVRDGAAAFSSDFGKKWVKNNRVRELKEVTDKTFKGVKIKFERIPVPLMAKIEYFYICEKCGKVYWDGGHWQRELCRKREAKLLKE